MLNRVPVGEADELVTLYTEQFGKIRAKAKSIRKITSKVSSQLQPLTCAHVRLIRRNGPGDGFSILDALAEDGQGAHGDYVRLIPAARLILNMTHEWEKDDRLWEYIQKIVHEPQDANVIQKTMLDIFGFDTTHAECFLCKKVPVSAFFLKQSDFICKDCASKIDKSEVLLI